MTALTIVGIVIIVLWLAALLRLKALEERWSDIVVVLIAGTVGTWPPLIGLVLIVLGALK